MGWFGKKKEPETVTFTQTFELEGNPRPVRSDVVDAIDDRLEAVGGEVMHAIDPARLMSFRDGGPPVWSVATTEVAGPTPYTLFVTYGFSHQLSPEPDLEGKNYEFSIAIANSPTQPWAVALLRHLCRYQLSSGNELRVGDVMPCHAPITYIPFPPQHHGMMPPTDKDSVVVVDDPVLGAIQTPYGSIGVRRIVGVTMADLQEIGPQPAAQRASVLGAINPSFLTVL